MGYIIWTKGWSSADDGTVLGGADLLNIQNDITSAVNGGISNANIASDAAISESKTAFDTAAGHTHNGTDSAPAVALKHYIKGGKITRVDNGNLTIGPVTLDIGGTLFTSVAASASIDVSVNSNYLTPDGGSAGDEPLDGPVYVYAYSNSGTLAFKLGDENAAPTLSNNDATVAEYPLRYISDGTIYYRLIGIIHNRVHLIENSIVQVSKNFACGSFIGDGATEEVVTGWTPKYIRVVQMPDSTPAAGEDIKENFIDAFGFSNAAPYPQDLNFSNQAAITDLIDEDVAGSITAIVAQSAGVAGGFAVFEPTSGAVVQWVAWTDEV